jgi:hypothetical protein
MGNELSFGVPRAQCTTWRSFDNSTAGSSRRLSDSIVEVGHGCRHGVQIVLKEWTAKMRILAEGVPYSFASYCPVSAGYGGTATRMVLSRRLSIHWDVLADTGHAELGALLMSSRQSKIPGAL